MLRSVVSDPSLRPLIAECLGYIAEHARDGDARIVQTMALAIAWADHTDDLNAADLAHIRRFRRNLPSVRMLQGNGVTDVHTMALAMWIRPPPHPPCRNVAMGLDHDWTQLHRLTDEPTGRFVDSLSLCALVAATNILEHTCGYSPPEHVPVTVERFVTAWRAHYATHGDPRTIHFAYHFVMGHTLFGHRIETEHASLLGPEVELVRSWLAAHSSDLVDAVGAHATSELLILATTLDVPVQPRFRKDWMERIADEWRRMRATDVGLALHMSVNLLYASVIPPATPVLTIKRKFKKKRKRRSFIAGHGTDE